MLDKCLPWPDGAEDLARLLAVDADPASGLAGLCGGRPHRALHGRTRSLLTFTPEMFDMLDELKVPAAHDVTVLLIGETGSGKTYLARLIHELSARRDERCLTVACGALPADLIESELFGYVKGAFTGADRDKQGKFAAAGAGTLLLDEIDVLPLEQQARLLRVIETGEYEPVGSNETQVSQARLIVASNYDLAGLVEQGAFRKDLYFRLNMLSFRLSPLRERPLDVEFLARKFALDHSRAYQIQLRHIEPEFLDILRGYAWPGNIRELENVVRRAVLYCRRGVLTAADLPSAIRHAPTEPREAPAAASAPQPATLGSRVDHVEQRIIEETLRRHNNHRTATARELGISRVTLYNKMKKFGMLTA
jgi:transcriptional regulator with PAS, ATPase and Fis domain